VTDRIIAAAQDFEVEIVNYQPRIKQNP